MEVVGPGAKLVTLDRENPPKGERFPVKRPFSSKFGRAFAGGETTFGGLMFPRPPVTPLRGPYSASLSISFCLTARSICSMVLVAACARLTDGSVVGPGANAVGFERELGALGAEGLAGVANP